MSGYCSFTLDEEIKTIMLTTANAVQTNQIEQILHFYSEDVTVFGIDKTGGQGRAGELTHHPGAFYSEEDPQQQTYKIK